MKWGFQPVGVLWLDPLVSKKVQTPTEAFSCRWGVLNISLSPVDSPVSNNITNKLQRELNNFFQCGH